MATRVKSGRSITWFLAGFAVTVLFLCLACVGATMTVVIGWWAPGLAGFVAVGVLALAVRRYARAPAVRSH
jgi:hypothetical protein